ncbi:NAD-dependent epimerase/dehydratase family protein [Verrucomicrobia bacterium]|nr:NAD-dependent epimerase/dehydratase family protein [Verrucomicrobiota bacterium]
MKILITGAKGFVGRNLCLFLNAQDELQFTTIARDDSEQALRTGLKECDLVFHLAGVNRPKEDNEFQQGNEDFTKRLCDILLQEGSKPIVVFASSIQAERNNPYGRSKRAAEKVIEDCCSEMGGNAVIFRFKNMFGKWCKPNYNSVTATFCHNIANGLPIEISNKDFELELIYIDEVIQSLLSVIDDPPKGCEFRDGPRSFRITLGNLAERIKGYHASRETLRLADFGDDFNRFLYSTYLSYLDGPDFGYSLKQRNDPRGSLAEFVKSESAGQIFVSRTKPGIIRGNHFHHTKTEKFLVLEGQAVIRFRRFGENEVIEHKVDGRDYRVLDIPPGYTHSIENVGQGDMVTLFWASETFDPERPDTYFEEVFPGDSESASQEKNL